MAVIGSKKAVDLIVKKSLEAYRNDGVDSFISVFHKTILKQKIRFPILEHVAGKIIWEIRLEEFPIVAKRIIQCGEIGGNVVAAILIQRTQYLLKRKFELAIEAILEGGEWYCCDIIAERVMGVSLLNQPEKAIQELHKLSKSKEELVVRTIGVAAHYAVKKGLQKQYVGEVFKLLLSLGNATEFHIKTGIGWGAKTCAKFHPDIVKKYEAIYNNPNGVGQWFRSKLAIGFSRNYKYATRYTN